VTPVEALINGLALEGDAALSRGVVMAFRERYERECRPAVLMCGCERWLTCAHPWPSVVQWPTIV
jgi:hypothetical protein